MKIILRKRENRLNTFGVNRKQQRNMGIIKYIYQILKTYRLFLEWRFCPSITSS